MKKVNWKFVTLCQSDRHKALSLIISFRTRYAIANIHLILIQSYLMLFGIKCMASYAVKHISAIKRDKRVGDWFYIRIADLQVIKEVARGFVTATPFLLIVITPFPDGNNKR